MWSSMEMMDIMPTINEDGVSSRSSFSGAAGDGDEGGHGEDPQFEQLMVTMLDERDKYMEALRDTQEQLNEAKARISELEKEVQSLQHQLDISLPQDVAVLVKQLNHLRLNLEERDEEIQELKAERNNTKLLLEHLECLVSRYDRTIRSTVVRRQAGGGSNSQASNEQEVLQALKSLFEHHKALDEKVRKKLRVAQERNEMLEEELIVRDKEIFTLKSALDQPKPHLEVAGNGPTLAEASTSKPDGLPPSPSMATFLEAQSQSARKIAELESYIAQQKEELAKFKDNSVKLSREYAEVAAAKQDLEIRIGGLEKRHRSTQQESASLQELTTKLESDVVSKEASIRVLNDRLHSLQQMYELAEKALTAHGDSDVDGEEKQMGASAEENMRRLESQLEEKRADVLRGRQREKINEEHNAKLTETVEKLVAEQKDRLQSHLKERMEALEEKNALVLELERTKTELEESVVAKQRMDDQMRQMQATITNLSSRSNPPNNMNGYTDGMGYSVQNGMGSLRRNAPGRQRIIDGEHSKIQVLTTGEAEWEKVQQAHVLANVQHAFDCVDAHMDDFDERHLFASGDMLSPSGQTDAQSLAMMLQQQLDAINHEIRMIQEEKQNAELRTEELESQVGSIDFHYIGRKSPERLPRGEMETTGVYGSNGNGGAGHEKLNPVMMLAEIEKDWKETDDVHTIVHEGSPPSNPVNVPQSNTFPRSVNGVAGGPAMYDRSGHTHGLGFVDGGVTYANHLNRSGNMESSHDTPSPVSSGHSSQDSLHRQVQPGFPVQKKRSIRNSFGKLFNKKEKKVLQQTANQQAAAGGSRSLVHIAHNDVDLFSPERDAEPNGPLERLPGASPGGPVDFDRRKRKKVDILTAALNKGDPFVMWDGATIVAWLEVWVGMPDWYVSVCKSNVKSGAIMASLSDTEMQREIGIANPLHRLKLRLAIQEMVDITSPSATKTTRAAFAGMNHEWVGNYWLPSLGLPQYRSTFMECLVDARMLDHLTKKDLRGQLKMVDGFHRTSFQYGIACLDRLGFNRRELEERRKRCETEPKDVIVWSNDRVIQWIVAIGLKEFAENLQESGIHGAVIALDEAFDHNSLALALQIPTQNRFARELLERELRDLINTATDRRHSVGVPGQSSANARLHHTL
ncbi:liprin-alpha-1-like [Paramacrobiotus metropolitanus]|uniref:liprin-alpha-1-like n=1 Tax=Paramacrobiotus metropolitanus TaxID=2943436 RepID=UPI0024457BAD|nr:liprin-alpha-1-like [Paramacrobiotus metropolitanus]